MSVQCYAKVHLLARDWFATKLMLLIAILLGVLDRFRLRIIHHRHHIPLHEPPPMIERVARGVSVMPRVPIIGNRIPAMSNILRVEVVTGGLSLGLETDAKIDP